MANFEHGLEYLGPEIENLLSEGIDAVSEDVIVVDESNETVGCLLRLTDTEDIENPYEEFGDLLENEGYDKGERIGSVSYSTNLDPDGIEAAISQPYVEAISVSRAVYLG